jgi:hypothetical protein
MRKLLGVGLVMFLAQASQGAVTVVANYGAAGNFTGPSPASGWSYSWNPAGVNLTTGSGASTAANVANWSPLVFNSTDSSFETASSGALPHAAPGSFLSAGASGVKLGDTATTAADTHSHYVILGYTFSASQIANFGSDLKFHSYDFEVPNDPTLDPLDVEIFKNTQLIAEFPFPAPTSFSDSTFVQDYPFGTVQAGDTLYIALGGSGNYAGQSIGVAYTLGLVPEPAGIGAILFGATLLRRRKSK